PSRGLALGDDVQLAEGGPLAVARASGAAPGERFDVIDVSSDFIDAAPANVTALTVEAMQAYLAALDPDGMVSVPVSIRDFPVYAFRIMATAREALIRAGVERPEDHVMVYRSAWN
ncbi:MAG TPA: hypothetical protein DCX75_08560, partial [Brevundimonas sp.]|nr:hypothetical protein [Brevundimonas sp.]